MMRYPQDRGNAHPHPKTSPSHPLTLSLSPSPSPFTPALLPDKEWRLKSDHGIADFAFANKADDMTQNEKGAPIEHGWASFTVYLLRRDGAIHSLYPVGDKGRILIDHRIDLYKFPR